MMFGDDNPSTRAEVKEKLRAAALRRGPQGEATILKMRMTKLKRCIVNNFRNKNFIVNKSATIINRYESYLAFMYEHKPRCKRIIHFLSGLLNECKNFVKKKYPKNRRSSPRGKIQAISNSKMGTKWFTSPDLLTSKKHFVIL